MASAGNGAGGDGLTAVTPFKIKVGLWLLAWAAMLAVQTPAKVITAVLVFWGIALYLVHGKGDGKVLGALFVGALLNLSLLNVPQFGPWADKTGKQAVDLPAPGAPTLPLATIGGPTTVAPAPAGQPASFPAVAPGR